MNAIPENIPLDIIYEDADLQNGSVFAKGDEYSEQVYEIAAPAEGNLKGLWMASSPIDTVLTDATGNQYKPGILDPRAFTNPKGLVFSAFKPQVGDIITISYRSLHNGLLSHCWLNNSTLLHCCSFFRQCDL